MTKRAVVTGANSGIGLATAHRLARDGFEVWAGARSADGLAAIEQAAADAGLDSIRPVPLDVTDGASVHAAFAAIQADGPVDVLVNNAGITGAGSVEETPIETYQAMFDTNVLGVVRCIQEVLPGMRAARSGRIVNISSSSAIQSPPLMAPYATTKMAVEGISESLQAEVAPYGIRVAAIQAGTIMTPIWGKNPPPPDDTPYPEARDFLLKVLSHQLMNSGVPAEAVADVIADAVATDAPPLRHLVGDAEHLAVLQAKHGDEVIEAFFLDREAFRRRYADLAGIDYWA
ncbi:MAG TPA: SDR family oxidoreductase [Acidimicrobiales bacterium]|nr:SDR family oxidoreductase [Acidimicrobiales bacterium]